MNRIEIEIQYKHNDVPLIKLQTKYPGCRVLKRTNTEKHALRWRHNECDSVSNHQPNNCLLNRLPGADQSKHQSSASLAIVLGIHRGPVNSPHKWPVTRKMFPFDDVIMYIQISFQQFHFYSIFGHLVPYKQQRQVFTSCCFIIRWLQT